MCVCLRASFCLCVLPLCVCRWVLKYYFSYKYLKYLAVCCFRLCVSIMCISNQKPFNNTQAQQLQQHYTQLNKPGSVAISLKPRNPDYVQKKANIPNFITLTPLAIHYLYAKEI